MPANESHVPGDPLARLVDEVGSRMLALTSHERGICVGSELPAIDRVLSRIRDEGLAQGPVFCEWGSGLGGVCGVAALNGFSPLGIEIQGEFVASARSLAEDLGLPMIFVEGTFLLPGDEDLAADPDSHTRLAFNQRAWDEIDLMPEDFDVVFAYPWPGEEILVDSVFARHACPGALLLTYHDFGRVLVQRKPVLDQELQILGWM
jgi:hypothetical protein